MRSPIRRAAVVGSGYMGGGIAQSLALAGLDVVICDVDARAAVAGRERLIAQARALEKREIFPQGAADEIAGRLSLAETLEDAVADAHLVIEAVPEDIPIKDDVLARMSRVAPATTTIGSNTSAIPIARLAKSVVHPERFLGVHWMNPAPFIPCVELIPTALTDPAILPPIEAVLSKAGKVAVRVSDSPGFVANRLQFALFKEAVLMVESGVATPSQIDLVVANAFGFRLALFGPFAIADMAGLDVYERSFDSLSAALGERMAAPELLHRLVADGRLGTKSEGGFLDIDPSRLADLAEYRDHAYARLAQLRAELGSAPGLPS